MFSTLRQRLLLGVYIFVLLSIPVGTYLVSQYQTIKSSAKEPNATKTITQATPTTSPAKELLSASESRVSASPTPSPSSGSTSPILASAFGPTLSLKVTLDGRPSNNQATKLFVGIVDGTLTSNPKFLLSFSVDLPASGEYGNLSLAGLSPGSTYTALLKGSAQIATSSAFTMSPTTSNLNDGQPINLLSGDLNDDNVINSADYSIAQKALGSTANSSNWNANADLNKDGVVNTFDLGIISKNIGQTGASGAWTSPIPQTATSSASLTGPPIGGPPRGGAGHWVWVPEY